MVPTMTTEREILSPEAVERLGAVGAADIVVGIPSFNNARTIGHVVRAVQAGLAKYFPDRTALRIHSDGGSTDGTREVVAEAAADFQSLLLRHAPERFLKLVTPYQGIPGKGSAFRTVFEVARRLQAKACAVVDSDLRSITPEWLDLLLRPVLEDDFDFVAPLYHRHKFDGTITNSIVYPLTRSLYGKRVRQPIGGDFGFSGRLAAHWADQPVWETSIARYGIDIWMTTTALAGGFKVCQAFLGAKIHDAKDPGADLSAMLQQVLDTLLGLMGTHHSVWKGIRGSEPVPTFGFTYTVGLEPIPADPARLRARLRQGLADLHTIYRLFLPPPLLEELEGCAREEQGCPFPDTLWVALLHETALAFQERMLHPEHLLKSLTPLYLGKVAAFVEEMRDAGSEEVRRAWRRSAPFSSRKNRS
jgi:glycosyltransferase involved in cell wall biosynthesis